MENTNKFILLGLSSFALALTVNYFRKRKNNSNSEERNTKKTDLVKTVTFGPSEIIDENIDESSLIESDLVRRDSAVLSIDGSITAKSDFISCDGEFVRPTEEAELVTNKVETLIEEAKSVILKSGPSQDLDEIEAKSNELKAIVELLAVKADSTMAKIEPMKTEHLNNNSEELNKLVENLKLKEKDMNSVDVSKRTCERDSANNSPADFSTTNGSIHSDARSESSADGNDSGKGGSDTHVSNGDASDLVAVSPYPSHLITTERIVVYEFLLPQKLCGVLIGRYGSNVNDIKTRTGASLLIKKHPAQMKYKICSIEGTKSEIDHALEIVRDKFPSNKYPQVTLEQVNIPAASAVALVPDTLQLTLPPEVNCDVIVSNIVSTNHIFVQQPTHPTYPSLPRLDTCMAACYSQLDAPEVIRPVQEHLICAAPAYGGWYRARVISNEDSGVEDVDVSFVDYGGFARLQASSLKQIRVDFMSLPFQACECYLANIGPAEESGQWSIESCTIMEQLCQGWVLQARVVGYAPQGTPLVYLYKTDGSEVSPSPCKSHNFFMVYHSNSSVFI
ncbi:hypothetical protein QYM36_009155 [Artemia franciscana]|uniref:Tudor domain-containing protein n=1 Tax=Artemia franciscana TaxID=6661 RepID=A0AA88HYW6_ARTSF|nr:hypothetical protein QYM36_009155 [Artemia franciscana]